MKKSWLSILLLVFMTGFVMAAVNDCKLDVTLLNQDPYPAVQGDYVKLVFQVDGIDNPLCENVQFELLEQYPISFDPGTKHVVQIKGGTHVGTEYSSKLMIPYKVRVDSDALDGDNTIEVKYTHSAGSDSYYQTETFDLNVQDVRADFELFIKEYDPATSIMTLEILNIAESDVEAVTIDIPPQEGLLVKGARTNIIGDIDSMEYTTADFEIVPLEGELKLEISYSDSNGVRRVVQKGILYDSSYFSSRNGDEEGMSIMTIIIIVAVLFVVGYFLFKKFFFNGKRRR
jgi:uncharacterized membrane-anchored protein